MGTFMGDRPQRDLIGKQLGQYRLESLLGMGNRGQVFRGTHLLLDRPVAIKVMFSGLATHPDLYARFQQEAHLVAALHHLHLIEIYEFGEEEGILYQVMELMSEDSLASLLRLHPNHRLPLLLALDLARQAAAGLAVAHAQQIVHRDIKPTNLLLRRLPDVVHGTPNYLLKISDFDLAHMLEGGTQGLASASASALAYMSPEQCADQLLDACSDLYSLGVVLYEMITGWPPFQVNSIDEAVQKHTLLPPPPLRGLLSEVPESVEALVLRCLARQPSARFTSAGDLLAALEREIGDVKQITDLATVPLAAVTRTLTTPQELMAVPPQVALPPSPVTPLPASAMPGETSLIALANTRIGLTVTPRILLITPGQPVDLQIVLTNTGPKADWFTLSIEGVPAEWIRGIGQEVALNPGMQETVVLVITVERKPFNRARDYLVTIRARSRKNPQEFSLSNVTWIVQPFKEEMIGLQPRKAIGRGQANYILGIYNGSNVPNRYVLSGDDREQQLTYEFQANPVDLDVGQESQVPLEVHTRRRWLGQQNVGFELSVGQPGGPPTQHTPGVFVNKPLLPAWLVAAVLALVLIGGGVLGATSGLFPFGQRSGSPLTQTTADAASQTTATSIAQNNAIAQANATGTAQAAGTVQANATGTAQANTTATAQANATSTAVPAATATATNASLPRPVQLAPLNGGSVSGGPTTWTATLQWSALQGAASYDIQIFSYPGGDTDCTTGGTPYPTSSADGLVHVITNSFTVTSTQAVPFCWQVWAVNGAGNSGSKSPNWKFTFKG